MLVLIICSNPVVVLVCCRSVGAALLFHNYYQSIPPLLPRQSFFAVAHPLCLLGFFGGGVYTGHRAHLLTSSIELM